LMTTSRRPLITVYKVDNNITQSVNLCSGSPDNVDDKITQTVGFCSTMLINN
jgi:hypothetical protein